MSQEDSPAPPGSTLGGPGDGDRGGMDGPHVEFDTDWHRQTLGAQYAGHAPLWPMPPHMQQGPPDGPWIPGPYQPGPPPRPRHRVRTVLLWAGGAFAGLVILGAVASAISPAQQPARPALAPSSAPLVPASSGQAAVPGAAPSPSASFNAAAVTVAGCRDLAAWENGNSQVTFNRDPQSQVILAESAGTQFASDLRAWLDDLNTADPQSALADAHALARDCQAVGVHSGLG